MTKFIFRDKAPEACIEPNHLFAEICTLTPNEVLSSYVNSQPINGDLAEGLINSDQYKKTLLELERLYEMMDAAIEKTHELYQSNDL